MKNKLIEQLEKLTGKKVLLENIEDGYVIEIQKNNRLFFLTEYDNDFKLTWRKDYAKIFNSIEEAEVYIKKNNLEKGILWSTAIVGKPYTIRKYSDVKSH